MLLKSTRDHLLSRLFTYRAILSRLHVQISRIAKFCTHHFFLTSRLHFVFLALSSPHNFELFYSRVL